MYVEIRASRRLAWLLAAVHVIACGVLLLVALPVTLKIAGTLLLASVAVRDVRRYALLTEPNAVIALRLSEEGVCEVRDRCGIRLTCRIDGSTYVVPSLIVLRLVPKGRRRAVSVILLPDSLDRDALRRLRVRLGWVDRAHPERLERTVSL